MAKCPVCGSRTSAKKGDPTPDHQPPGDRKKCDGSGQPAV
ncbi:hypothetical protein Acsp04_63810 [Actinomadura sp. NBRC 104425]|nr:hypothetical protein Acsp04_63810 [Actinomadura sp. NBRC 104425]